MTLPHRHVPRQGLPAAHAPTSYEGRSPVLLLQDQAGDLDMCKDMLVQLGYEVDVLEEAARVVRACEDGAPTALIVDLHTQLVLIEQVRELQRHGRLPWFPVLAMTTMTAEPSEQEGRRLLTDGLLVRPLELRQVAVALARAVGPAALDWGRPEAQDGQSLSPPAPEDDGDVSEPRPGTGR